MTAAPAMGKPPALTPSRTDDGIGLRNPAEFDFLPGGATILHRKYSDLVWMMVMTISKTDTDRRVEALMQACRAQGLKVTHQRMEIVRELASSAEHPDAEGIFQRVRLRVAGISRDTVYRTLSMLESRGLIRKADALGGPARYDADTTPHHHFVCTQCGRIEDFTSETLDRLPIPKVAESFGRVEFAQVHLRGVCSDCAGKDSSG
jgi:Fur family transcriptional regulator, peroxide stress response regulator